MKKIMFITLTILFALSASSCRDKKEQNRTEQQIENAKENVNDALDKASMVPTKLKMPGKKPRKTCNKVRKR